MSSQSKVIDTFQPSLLSAALHNIDIGILILKRSGEVIFCNREANRLLGSPQETISVSLLNDVFFTLDGNKVSEAGNPIRRAIVDNDFGSGSFKLISPGASSFIVECRTESLVPSAFDMPGILVSLTDTTLHHLEQKALKANNVGLISENKKLRELAMFDKLTNLRNRNYFDLVLSKRMDDAILHSKPLSLLIIDIDFFKGYNDHYGHLKGDECLAKVAAILQDIVDPDYVARFGGEEFCILLPEADQNAAESVATDILKRVRAARIKHESSPYKQITASIGICSTDDSRPRSARELIRLADKALYDAKHCGRNRVVAYSNQGLQEAS